MKKKNNGMINEDAINDLIHYAEDEDNTPEISDVTEESETETPAASGDASAEDTPVSGDNEPEQDDDYDNYNDYNDYDDGDEKLIFEKGKGSTKLGVIIGIAVGLAAVIAFITVDTGIIGNYKKNFSQNFSHIFANFKPEKKSVPRETLKPTEQYNTKIKSNKTMSLEGAGSTEFAPYRGGVVCAKMNHMSFMDSGGNVVWETDTAIVDPILRAEGNYILLAENGRNKICLYNDSRLVYDTDDPDTITAAQLSSNGDVVIVTNKPSYKGGISVYNKTGAQIFSWSSGSDKVICADISAASRRVAAATLNTDTAVKTIIQLFDVNETESLAKVEMENTVVFDVQFAGKTLNAFGDNRIAGISSSGKIIYDNVFEDGQLSHSIADSDGNKLLVLDENNVPTVNLYSPRGSLKDSVTLTGIADFIDISGRNIIYNTGRDIYFGDIYAKVKNKYTATMDIKKLLILSESSFVIVYSNSIEFVTV